MVESPNACPHRAEMILKGNEAPGGVSKQVCSMANWNSVWRNEDARVDRSMSEEIEHRSRDAARN